MPTEPITSRFKLVIQYGKQSISEEDIEAVSEVLRSDFLTQGPLVPRFESAISSRVGAKHGVAVNSATSALHVACMACGLTEGDWLWTSAITFVASANCGVYCGARVDFVDIDPTTYNLCPEALHKKLERARQEGALPKILVVVHLCGLPCPMERLRSLADEYGFMIIEDASHAIGAEYLGQPIGSCEFSDITVFSFHPVKIITSAEGGMAMTNSEILARAMASARSHGITREVSLMTEPPHGPWHYQQIGLGFNYRLTELQAALGLSQLDRLDEFIMSRALIADRYDDLLAELPIQLPSRPLNLKSSLHLYVIRVSQGEQRHRHIFEFLRQEGVGVNLHYMPVYRHPFYRKMGFKKGYCPEAEAYYREAISLPIHPSLDSAEQTTVIEALTKAIDIY